MKFVADLHLHSKYSRAVSAAMTLPNMSKWAKYKGIQVLATGDFTHPFWLEQIKQELEESGNGLFRLKSNSEKLAKDTHFMLSCEVSSIYSQGGKGRRIHNLFFFPKIESVVQFNKELVNRGANLRSDGRPIVGLSSRDLVELALDCDEKAIVVPAHIWTPWFSVFGSFSGFDSIGECFGDMEKYIYGVETGLSSDPAMNWRIGDLDSRSILSFSDAHSLEKMGREATVFEAEEISYDSIYDGIKKNSNGSSRVAFTIEFHPEEGKYHFTGHRNCNFSKGPGDSDVCPKCGRSLTVGVMQRVEDLADDEEQVKKEVVGDVLWNLPIYKGRAPYVSLVPLIEIIAESLSQTTYSKKVKDTYAAMIDSLGSEFAILLKVPIEDISKYSQKVAEGVLKVRKSEIVVEPGYDGLYGIVKIWNENANKTVEDPQQGSLFA